MTEQKGKIAVVALGGNAISREFEEGNIFQQFANTRRSLIGVIRLIQKGYRLVITHGNGPQVGNALIRVEATRHLVPPIPLGVLVADLEGGMGYMIEQSLQNKLNKRGIDRQVVTLLTQVVVDKNDPSVLNPTKFVGPFYDGDQVEQLRNERNYVVKHDPGRGYRRVVPSPKPLEIVEKKIIKHLVEMGVIVIAAGGGGIPVYVEPDGRLEGVDGVIDKDLAASILATDIQAKEILRQAGVPVPTGKVAFSAGEARKNAEELSGEVYVVKAQIHAGGRSKGGGVKLARSLSEVEDIAGQMLGMTLVTHQTGPEGKKVRKVLVEEGLEIERELYLGIVLDRATSQLVVMASTEGGVEIEKVAAETPEKILKIHIDPDIGLQPFQARKLAFGLNLKGDAFKNAIKFIRALYKVYFQYDCSLIEINPLVITKDQRVLALDAKLNVDDSALRRQPKIVEMRDFDEEAPLEVEASKYDLNYIKLDGNVACMVNGAGLAMATMDIIKLCGGEPANFLDVGGGASAETVEKGFRILMADKNVKAVLINIFGGIVRCDRVAKGVIEAISNMEVNLPVVVRLEGTNAVEAAELLEKSPLEFGVARSFQEAAEKVVEVLK